LDFTDLRLKDPFRSWYLNGLQYLFKPKSDPREVLSPSRHEAEPKKSIRFPAPWDEIWASSRPPYTSVWTYWDLCQDIGSSHDPDRKVLFDRILDALQRTRYEVFFWPVTVFAEGNWQVRQDLFWHGVRMSGACTVVCFGERVFQALFPDAATAYTSLSHEGYQVVYVPGPEEMLPDNREAKRIVWKMLKRTLS
jgi:hypothetical protein